MPPLGGYHKREALIGPEQTTRSTGGFDYSQATAGSSAQNRSCLLFHGLICLWLRNSESRCRQPASHSSVCRASLCSAWLPSSTGTLPGCLSTLNGMSQTLTMFGFELPAVFIITYLIAFRIVITIMQRKQFALQLKCNVKNFRCILTVAMFTDRIEITSPGGLPSDITEDEFLHSQISVLRNPRLGNVFYRLRYIERFGTGILRICHAYEKSYRKPEFYVFENSIKIMLPTFNMNWIRWMNKS